MRNDIVYVKVCIYAKLVLYYLPVSKQFIHYHLNLYASISNLSTGKQHEKPNLFQF